jgi:hypothetical protein
MFPDELIARDVIIEGANKVIAIKIGPGDVRIPFATVGLRVTHKIHPMPRPVLAEPGGVQQAIDRLCDRRRFLKRLHLSGGRRESGENECQSPN